MQTSRIVIDGKEVGMSPLLLSDINRNSRVLQIFGDTLYSEYTINFDRNKSNITRIYPEGVPYYGFLKLSSVTEDSSLLLDGEEISLSVNTPVQLLEGDHLCVLSKEGFFTREVPISIKRLETLTIELDLEQQYQVILPENLPVGSRIICSNENETKEFIFDGNSPLPLRKGQWDLTISNVLFEDLTISLSLENPVTPVELDLHYYQPVITLLGVKKGSQITLNETVIEAEEDEESLELPAQAGENLLLIKRTGYVDLSEKISLEGNQILDINLEFDVDPQVISDRRRSTGWIMIGTGLALFSGGLYMNQDDVLISTSNNYEQYKTLKYTSLGLAGSGILSFLTGSGFLGLASTGKDS